MIVYQHKSNFYRAAEGAGSGGAGNPGAGGAASAATEVDPFMAVDLDDLDPVTRKAIETAKASFASLQKQTEDAVRAQAQQEKLARDFQARYDQLQAKQQQQQQQLPTDPRDQMVGQFVQTLIAKGVPAEQAKLQAPLMFDLLETHGEKLKADIGRDMAPFANAVLHNEAQQAWTTAAGPLSDKLGALQIPEVQVKVAEQVQALLSQGQQVTAATIKNLSSMFYVEHMENSSQQQQQQPQLPQFSFRPPGMGAAPQQRQVVDPKAPRTTLDPATSAALQHVMGNWDVKPKAFINPNPRR